MVLVGKRYKVESYNFANNLICPSNTIAIDKPLLMSLLGIIAPSMKEEPVSDFILNWLATNKIQCGFDVDYNGNIYIIKGKAPLYPCIVAHMDEVCGYEEARKVVDLGNILVGLNPNSGEFAGCPGDDRVGVYCALEMLRILPACKVCFFVEEEIGAKHGSEQAPLSFFNDCTFILQADRTDNYEWITDSNGGQICSDEFIRATKGLTAEYAYQYSEYGSFTDCGVLSSRGVGISCVNLGAGYYDSHSVEEKVCVNDVENVMNLMYRVCTQFIHKKWKNCFKDAYKENWYKYYDPTDKDKKGTPIDYHTYDDYDDIYSEARWGITVDEKDIIDATEFALEEDYTCSKCHKIDCTCCKLVQS